MSSNWSGQRNPGYLLARSTPMTAAGELTPQCCSTLEYLGIVEEIIQAQSVVMERFADVGDLVFA
jgi:hypothetical protein